MQVNCASPLQAPVEEEGADQWVGLHHSVHHLVVPQGCDEQRVWEPVPKLVWKKVQAQVCKLGVWFGSANGGAEFFGEIYDFVM